MTNPIVPSITDEQLEELEAALLDADDDYPLKDLWMALVNRLRAAEADAKRYRWLRDKANNTPGQAPAVVMLTEDCKPAWDVAGHAHRSLVYGVHLDSAIDTAMEHKP